MRVEGVSISAIARITGRSRSTIARWLERAVAWAKRFNDEHLRMFEIKELQVDELCNFVGSKTDTVWVFSIIEVTSRLWPTSVVGRRSFRNTELLFLTVESPLLLRVRLYSLDRLFHSRREVERPSTSNSLKLLETGQHGAFDNV